MPDEPDPAAEPGLPVEPPSARRLLGELLELTEAEQTARLAEVAAVDAALADELRELLNAEARAPASFLEGDAPSTTLWEAVAEAHDAAANAAGSLVGPYRLVELLGRGGMGEVWRAERADGQFTQTVALKLVKRGMDSDQILRRFLLERQILARLDHPGIARLLDGGVAADGRPYFALELVEGDTITSHAARRGAGVSERVRLLFDACEAVAAAHARLVVHRDLKPSNILVTAGGRVKLLDFGIAKLLEGDAEATGLTRSVLPMTPAYAAPEQIRGEPVTTATDVYALGAVLYELLAGRAPFARQASSSAALAEEVGRETLTRPSRVAAERPAGAKLARQLAGDLDTITVKALHADPARRYGSVEALGADLRRYLDGRPVLARPDSLGYRIGKLARRNRLATAAAVLALLAILSGLALALWQAGIARASARRAEAEAAHARRVQEFMVQLFEGADPTRTLGASLSARQLLDEGARRLPRELRGDPETRAAVAEAFARTYRALGLLDEGQRFAREAVTARRRLGGESALSTARAELTAAEVAADHGDLPAARVALTSLLPRFDRGLGTDSRESQRTRSALGTVLGALGDEQESLRLLRANVDSARRTRGEDSSETASALGNLASTEGILGHFREAAALQRDALARLARVGGADSPQAITIETELAQILGLLGETAEAEERFKGLIVRSRQVLGPHHPQTGEVLIKYGSLLGQLNRNRESDAALTEAAAIFKPLGHFDYGAAIRYRGYNALGEERFADAAADFAEAERFFREKVGDDNPMTWAAVVTRAAAQMKTGRLAEAERGQRAAIAALTRLQGAESDAVRAPTKHLGETLRRQGRIAEAIAMHERARAIETKLYGGKETIGTATTHLQLAEDHLAERTPTGLVTARREIEAVLAFFGARPDPARLGHALELSARIAVAEGDRARARRELARAAELLAEGLPAGAPSVAEARRELAELGG